MAKDNFSSTDKLYSGIDKVVDILAPTYGVAGKNVVIERIESPFYITTNDAKSIVDAIRFEEPIEEMGRKILANSTDLAERESGDGRKTTCLLTASILKESANTSEDKMEIYHSLQSCITLVTDSIDRQKSLITVDEVKAVASIAAESEDTGALIQEIYQKTGKDAIIEIDASGLPESFYTLEAGYRIRTGCLGEYSKNQEEGTKAVYENPLILISKEKIISKDQINPILSFVKNNGKDQLVIYCEDIDLSVLSALAMTHLSGGFKTLVIKAPVLWKDWIYEDLAKLTGATPIDFKNGKTFKTVLATDFGTCDKIISNATETRIIGTKDIAAHIANLEERAQHDDQQKVRISWLQKQIAVLKIGGNSDTEIAYRLKKARDACSSAYWALRDGVVAGGATSLVEAIKSLPDTIGGRILKVSLRVPYEQQCKNMRVDNFVPDVSVQDAALTVKNAVKNAISIAGTNLTAGTVITLNKPENPMMMPTIMR